MTQTNTNLIEVIQADRDAAAEHTMRGHGKIGEYTFSAEYMIRTGHWDDDPLVQAFARHRLSVSTECEALREAGQRAEAWLRECSSWLLTNDLDMTCPMETDPLDIADDLAALSVSHGVTGEGEQGGGASSASAEDRAGGPADLSPVPGLSPDGRSSHSAEGCGDCGRPNPVWFAPNALWNRVIGGAGAVDDPGGIVCPNCFISRSEAAGVVPTAWLLAPELSAERIARALYPNAWRNSDAGGLGYALDGEIRHSLNLARAVVESFAQWDGSGEAGETGTGSTEGDSPVPTEGRDAPTLPDSPSTQGIEP